MRQGIKDIYRLSIALLLTASLVACGTDSGSSGGSSSGDRGSGFTLRVTDAPFDHAVRLDVWFDAAHFKPVDGDWIEIPTQGTLVDLAALQGTKSLALVSDVDLPPGDYSGLRLIVDESKSELETMDGNVYPLIIPTGAKPGLLINEPFTVFEDKPGELVLDFDLRLSLRVSGTTVTPLNPLGRQYRLLPFVRVVHGNNYGHLRGMVDGSLLLPPSDCSDDLLETYNAVYVFKGHDARLDDIKPGNSKGDLVTTSKITWDEISMSHIYEAGFLPAGDYTIALTCNADLDDPDKNDDVDVLKFFGVQETAVKVNNLIFF